MNRFVLPFCVALSFNAACALAPEVADDDVITLTPDGPLDRAGLSVILSQPLQTKTLEFDCATECDIELRLDATISGTEDRGVASLGLTGPDHFVGGIRSFRGQKTLHFAKLAPGHYEARLANPSSDPRPVRIELEASFTESREPLPGGHAVLDMAGKGTEPDDSHLRFVCEEAGGCDVSMYARLSELSGTAYVPTEVTMSRVWVELTDEDEVYRRVTFKRVGTSDLFEARARGLRADVGYDLFARLTGSVQSHLELGVAWTPVDAPTDAISRVAELLSLRQQSAGCAMPGRDETLDGVAVRAAADEIQPSEVEGTTWSRMTSDLPIPARLVNMAASDVGLDARIAGCALFGIGQHVDDQGRTQLVVVTLGRD